MSIRPRLVAVSVLAVLLTGCAAQDPTPAANETRTDRHPGSNPDGRGKSAPGKGASSGESRETGVRVTVPVYFVADTPQGPRLFREFRKVDAGNPLEEAAALLTSGDALDPDYRTLFPGGAFTSVEQVGDEIVAEVPDDGWRTRAPGMTEREARLAVQSLVYTLQGVAQTRARVLVSLGGGSDWVPIFGVFDSNGFREAPALDVLGLVSVTSPEQGATVGGTFTASGVASSFEATVPWEVRRDGDVVLSGFATAEGWMDKLYPWETEVDVSGLAPGTYEFVAMTDDPSGGEGAGPTRDSKTFTID